MARNGDGLFRRDGIWYFKYKNQCGIYQGKKHRQNAKEIITHRLRDGITIVLDWRNDAPEG